MYALVDCNNFYCSCERVFNPKLERRPVIVLSNNDGCAIARSEEAKALGIAMGTPAFMIRDLIEQHQVAVFSSNYTLYGDMSQRVIDVLSSLAPKTEVYSIDECFIDLSKIAYTSLTKLATKIRNKVMQWTGIPVSVGIAPTKTLAKLANRFAKKRKGVGVYHLDSQAAINEALASTEVGDIWGIGAQHERLLKTHGYHSALDLTKAPDEWIRKNMSVVGQRMVNELRGIPCIEWAETPPPKKGICTARSFGKLLTNKEPIREAVANYAAMCAKKLRDQNSCARVMQVFLQTNAHRNQDRQFHHSITLQIPVATNSTNEIIGYALKGLDAIFQPGYNFIKAGVMIVDLVPNSEVQSGIFDNANRKRDNGLMKALDKVNKSFGKDIVRFAAQGYNGEWGLKHERLSPCYTTNINHILKIKI
ncbi:MAG: Y-family DNA polymerase [Chitinophagaceae bacterium]